MSGIKVEFENGEILILYPDSTQKFLLKSVLFSEKVEAPSRSFTFRIPATPNQVVFKNINKLDSRENVKSYNVKVYVFGNFWRNALLQITDFNEKEYSVRLLLDRGYYSEFGQRSLRSFDYNNPFKLRFYPSQLSRTEYVFQDVGVLSPAVLTIRFYITSNPTVLVTETFDYNPTTETEEDLVNKICERFNSKIYDYRYYAQPNTIAGAMLQLFNLTTPSAPSFFISSFTSSDGNLLIFGPTDTTTNGAVAYQEFYERALNDNDATCICFPVAAPEFFSEVNLNYWGYLNFYTPRIPGNPLYPGRFATAEQPLTPFAFLKYVLYTSHNENNIKIAVDEFFDEELSKIVLFNHERINNENRLSANGWRYREMGVFFFNDIVPDITISKLVNDFRYFFNTIIDYNSKGDYLSIIPVKNLLNKPEYIDWTDKAVKGYSIPQKKLIYELKYEWVGEPLEQELLPEIKAGQLGESVDFKTALGTVVNGFLIAKATKENKTYKYNTTTRAWDLFAEDLYNYEPADKTATLTTGATPLFTIEHPWTWINRPNNVPSNVKWLLPYTKQQGNMFATDEVAAPHRYLIYRSKNAPCSIKVNDGDEVDVYGEYPFGSSHNYDFEGNKIGNYSLAWLGEDGLVNTWWKDWLDYIKNVSPVKMPFTLTPKDISDLDLLKKIKVENTLYFIDEIEFEVDDSIENCIATMYPLKVPINE